MSPITEVIAQVLWFAGAIWLIYRGYVANKKAEPLSLRQPQKFSKGLDAMFVAGGFVGGLIMIILLVLKFMTCGPVCGAI
jgi:hypothetical protein